jgi:DNA polymerase-3 subunit epsilon
MRQLILDTETTGLDPTYGHRIIELAMLEMVDRTLTGNKFHLYFNPQRDIPTEATAVHGIALSDLHDAPLFEDKIDEIIAFIRDAELIIHNAKFDLKFLNHHFQIANYNMIENYSANVIDSLTIARRKFMGAKNNLDALCDRFKVNRSNRDYHGALIDCELLAQVYLHLTKEQIQLIDSESDKKNNTFTAFQSNTHRKAHLTSEQIEAHNQYTEKFNLTSF